MENIREKIGKAGKINGLVYSIVMTMFFSVSFFFCEMVFKEAILLKPPAASYLYPLFSSFIIGAVEAFIIMLLPKKGAYIAGFFVNFINSLGFIVEFLIFREFKVCYDLNTIFNGATDALSDFQSDIRALIFCADGIAHIMLFLCPFFAWAVYGKRIIYIREAFDDDQESFKRRFFNDTPVAAVTVSASLMFTTILLGLGLYRSVLGVEYNFQNAVNSCGFITSFVADAGRLIAGDVTEGGFEDVSFSDMSFDASSNILADASGNKTYNEASLNCVSTFDENIKMFPGAGFVQASPLVSPTGIYEEASDNKMIKDASSNAALLLLASPGVSKKTGPNIMDIDFDSLPDNGKAVSEIDEYVKSLVPSSKNAYTGLFKGKNLILICAEAFSGFVIDEELTPTLYRMAYKGINLNDYYQQASAGTTGGEYQLLFGMLPTAGGASMRQITVSEGRTNIGARLAEEGYRGYAFHNNSYTYYDRHLTHVKLGYSEGYMGVGNGMEKYVKRVWPESDLEMMKGTLPLYMDKEPFSVYYMTVSGHSDYTYSTNAMAKKNREFTDAWCEKKGLDYSERVRAYLASNVELDLAMEYLIGELEEAGIADDTVIVISGDHFPYGLDKDGTIGNLPYLSELYGYDVTNLPGRDKSRGIIWCGLLERYEPVVVDNPSSSIDMLPTLCNLFDVEWDSRLLPGRDIFSDALPLVFNSGYDWKTDKGLYLSSKGQFIPSDPSFTVTDEYIKAVKGIVRNKMKFCKSALNNDYYSHVFADGNEE